MPNAIYIVNKYHNWYHSITQNAKSQDRKKKNGTYYEDHHIHPESFGGLRTKENMVLLTGREHFICHLLLTKFTIGKYYYKAIKGIYRMMFSKQNDGKLTSKQYENLRDEYAKSVSLQMSGENHPNWDKSPSKKSRKLMSDSHLGQQSGKDSTRYIGDWVTPWGIFHSLRAASINCPTNMYITTIKNYCNNCERKVNKKMSSRSNYLTVKMIGKTLFEIGFDFISDSRNKHHKKPNLATGKNNISFIGYFYTPFAKLESSTHIINYTELITSCQIKTWCRNCTEKINKYHIAKSKYLQSLPESPLDKTFEEIGFWFIPK